MDLPSKLVQLAENTQEYFRRRFPALDGRSARSNYSPLSSLDDDNIRKYSLMPPCNRLICPHPAV
ncbi:hypothetical protein ZHAS_00015461 [Anopheles sinensis]|uniref:Uncharacterized protein n=1 Tax=Anopheles sinensis TaxID=74873 RepID=A0A084WBB2_ANOSI|nr:hypothetical protein ZHAS_00015461 [Anopheles sinensis]